MTEPANRRVTTALTAVLAALSARCPDGCSACANSGQDDGWRSQSEIAEATGRSDTTVAGVLARLEVAGHVETRWHNPDPRTRPVRHYRLTPDGTRYAAEVAARAVNAEPGG